MEEYCLHGTPKNEKSVIINSPSKPVLFFLLDTDEDIFEEYW